MPVAEIDGDRVFDELREDVGETDEDRLFVEEAVVVRVVVIVRVLVCDEVVVVELDIDTDAEDEELADAEDEGKELDVSDTLAELVEDAVGFTVSDPVEKADFVFVVVVVTVCVSCAERVREAVSVRVGLGDTDPEIDPVDVFETEIDRDPVGERVLVLEVVEVVVRVVVVVGVLDSAVVADCVKVVVADRVPRVLLVVVPVEEIDAVDVGVIL